MVTKKEAEFEFFGPYIGPIGIIVGLPLVCYALVFACNPQGCLQLNLGKPLSFPVGQKLFSVEAFFVYVAWFTLLVVLHCVLPGDKTEGTLLSDGSRLTYKLNGLRIFIITIGAAWYFGFFHRSLNLSWVYDNYVPLLTSSIIFSSLLSVYLYMSSFLKGRTLSKGGDTSYALYDFFIGRELNPRIGDFDLKEFCELYPGLIGWVLIDVGMAHKQYIQLGYVTPAMLLVCIFQAIYVFDALYFEKAILTTMDITTDGFGFMLAFGDLAWVPFTYTLQARFLVDYPQNLSPQFIWLIIGVNLLGYLMFRGANSQKDIFRRDPTHPRVARLRTLKTERGTQLIISGWWGIARHINYFGDWLMAWSWCLPTGLYSIIPYFYVIYFGILLVHRDRRDEHSCRLKYGKDWDRYCNIVKYRIVPFIY